MQGLQMQQVDFLEVDQMEVVQNVIDFITIATTGNAIDFGDMTSNQNNRWSASPTRGIWYVVI